MANRLLLPLPAMLLALSPLAPAQFEAEKHGETLAGVVPDGALAFFETAGLDGLIRAVRSSEVFQSVLASDDFEAFKSTHFFTEAASARKMAEFILRMSIWEASDKLLGGRLALAAYPAGVEEDPHVLLLVRPSLPSDWLKNRVRFAPLIRIGLKRIGRREFGEHVAAYRTRGKHPTYFGLHDGWIAVATDLGLLQKVVAMQEPGGGLLYDKSAALRGEGAFRGMSARMGENHLARAFLNTKQLGATTGANLGLPREIGDPVLALFLGGVVEMVENSRFAGFTLNYGDKQVLFKAGIDARPEEMAEEHRLFFSDGPSGGLPPPPQVPGYIGGFSLYRPFGDWYRKRDEAVQGALVPGLDAFEGGVGDLLLGSEGVIGDRVAFVSALAEDGGIDPAGVSLPGFAFVVDLAARDRADELLGPLFEAVLAEIDSGAEAPGEWRLVADEHAGVPVNFAERAGDSMRPAAARLGDRWVLSSSHSLCRHVIDSLQRGEPAGGDRDLAFELRFTELAKFFAGNQAAYEAELVRLGRTPQQAKADYANIAKLMGGMKSLSGESSAAEGAFSFTARGELK